MPSVRVMKARFYHARRARSTVVSRHSGRLRRRPCAVASAGVRSSGPGSKRTRGSPRARARELRLLARCRVRLGRGPVLLVLEGSEDRLPPLLEFLRVVEPTFAPGDLREELERSRDAAPAPRESIVFERFLERFPCRGSLALVEEDLPQAEERVGEDEAVPSVLDREGDD